MSRKRRILTSTLIGLVVIALIAGGARLRKKRLEEVTSVAPPGKAPWALRTAQVGRGSTSRAFPALGLVVSTAELTVASQFPGTILELGPREGVAVKRGDVLARIDTREIDDQIAGVVSQIEAGQVDADRLDKELERERDLLRAGGSSASEVEARESAAVAARKKVVTLQKQRSSLEVRRGFATVEAPADGVIAARLAEEGDLCVAFHPLYRIAAQGGARLSVKLPQGVLERVGPGTLIALVHGDERREVAATRIHPELDDLALGTVEADLSELPFGLPSGARLAVRVIIERRDDALLVPEDALLRSGDGSTARLFRIVSGESGPCLNAVGVVVDLVGDAGVAVSGPLQPGDRVALARDGLLRRLTDGDPVFQAETRP